MKARTIFLTNSYHGTRVKVKISGNVGGVVATITDSQAGRIRKQLCGVADCQCSNNTLKTVGEQSIKIMEQGGGITLYEEERTQT